MDADTAMALARVMVSAAWINGEVHPRQETTIRTILSKIPSVDDAVFQHVGTLLLRPMDIAERVTHLRDLREKLSDEGDIRLAQQAINEVIIAKGTITEADRSAMSQYSRMIRASENILFNEMIKIIRGLDAQAEQDKIVMRKGA